MMLIRNRNWKTGIQLAAVGLTLGCALTAHAGAGGSGGGNNMGIDFSVNARAAINEFDRLQLTHTYGVTLTQLTGALNSAQVIVDESALPLTETESGMKQPCDVINTPSQKRVTVHSQRWGAIVDTRRRKSEALHEVLSLLGKEGTGDYHISSAYESLANSSNSAISPQNCTTGCEDSPAAGNPFGFQNAEKYFAQGTHAAPDQLKGTWMEIGKATMPDWPLDSWSRADEYNEAGLQNPDFSIRYIDFSSETAFDGNIRNTMNLMHIGNGTEFQGLNAVNLTSDGACFAQWSYKDHALDPNVHFNYVCRLMASNIYRMICGISFHYAPGVTGSQAVFNDRIVYYKGYKKVVFRQNMGWDEDGEHP